MSKSRDIDMSISIDAAPDAVWRALSENAKALAARVSAAIVAAMS